MDLTTRIDIIILKTSYGSNLPIFFMLYMVLFNKVQAYVFIKIVDTLIC
jgi:hypothetical protein